jgi:hypothetical protein
VAPEQVVRPDRPPVPWRSIVLAALLVALAVSATLLADPITGDYSLFVEIARDMWSASGTHVFAAHPGAQTGPVSLTVVRVLDSIGTWSFPVFVGALGAVVVLVAGRLDGARRRSTAALAVGGAVLVVWWRAFVFHGHPDDALVLTIAVVALLLVQRDRRTAAAVAVGIALAVKPWAVLLVPITLAPSTHGRIGERLRGPLTSMAVGAALWSPFVVAEPSTLSNLKPNVWLAPDSVLRLLTGGRFAEPPSWLRGVQLLAMVAAAGWVVVRGRPASVLLVGVATRMLLDPGTWPYYSVGLVLGALVWDLEESEFALPIATLATSALLPLPQWLEVPELRALFRFVACGGGLLLGVHAVRRTGNGVAPDRPGRLGPWSRSERVVGVLHRARLSATVVVMVVLATVTIGAAILLRPDSPGDYAFFVNAFHDLIGRDGVYLYRWTPNVQTGPISLLGYGLAAVVGHAWFTAAVAVLGVALVWTVAETARRAGRPVSPLALGLGGLVTLLEWRSLATWGHLDDALVAASAVAAIVAHHVRRPWVAALVVGLSLAVKPWAVMFLPLAIDPAALHVAADASRDRIRRWVGAASGPLVAMLVGSAFWAPFVLASTATLEGIRPKVTIAPDSVLHLLTRQLGGVPAALRVMQLLLAMGVVLWTVWRGHAAAAVLGGVAVRLLVEAATWPYYSAVFVLGAFVWDALESRWRAPWATLAAAALLVQPGWIASGDLRAALRLVACLGALELVRRAAPGRSRLQSTVCSAEGGAGAPGGGEQVLVEGHAEAGQVAELHTAAV